MGLYDAIVVGAGFFGCELAKYLRTKRGFERILILEQGSRIMNRASRWNQARIHGGYHYPRDFATAHRSRTSLPIFVERYPSAVYRDVVSLYAIARRGSHVTAQTFLRRMEQVDAPIRRASQELSRFFSTALVRDVFEVEEKVFDADALRSLVREDLEDMAIECKLGSTVFRIEEDYDRSTLTARNPGGGEVQFESRYVFNCTYSGLSAVDNRGGVIRSELKHEIAELTLFEVPEGLKQFAITVMDGPFFSLVPYPPERVHSLSHVRYTPKHAWKDGSDARAPHQVLSEEPKDARSERMLRDASRFIPALRDALYVGSFREVKTVLVDREHNDARPILIEQSSKNRRLWSILGAKIDNVFDMFSYFDTVKFDLERAS